jgi:hypothetical protein
MTSFTRGSYTARMKLHSIFLGICFVALSGNSLAQWQWLDKDGRKVFSDRAPPADILEKNILKRPNSPLKAAPTDDAVAASAAAPASAAAAAAPALPVPSGLDKDLEAKKKQAAEAEAAKRKAAEEANMKIKIENCARAKQAKANFDSGIRIAQTNAAGERVFLDDAARATEVKRIQGIIESDCK